MSESPLMPVNPIDAVNMPLTPKRVDMPSLEEDLLQPWEIPPTEPTDTSDNQDDADDDTVEPGDVDADKDTDDSEPQDQAQDSSDTEPETYKVKVGDLEKDVTLQELIDNFGDPTTVLHKVKIDGEDRDVTYRELVNGYGLRTHLLETRQKEAAKFNEEYSKTVEQRQKYASKLTELETFLSKYIPQEEPDWASIRANNPNQFDQLYAQYKAQKDTLNSIRQEQQVISQQQQEELQREIQRRAAEGVSLLRNTVPEWQDANKMAEDFKALESFAQETYGFTAEEMRSVYDPRMVLLFRDAMQGTKTRGKAEDLFKKALGANMSGDNEGSKQPTNTNLTPGTRNRPPVNNTVSKEDVDLSKALNKAFESGSMDDASEALGHLLDRDEFLIDM